MTERHIEVQDRRNPGWFWSSNALVDDHLPEIGMQAFAVYMLLTRYANSDGQCYPAMSTIAARLGVGVSTVQRAIKALAAAGLLRVSSGKKKGDCNLYTLISAEGGRSQGTRGVGHTDLPGRSHRPTEQDPINKTQLNKKNILQSADADVPSAPSHPQGSDGQPNSPEMPDSSAETTSTRRDGIEDLPKSSAKKVSADTTPKRAPLPHIAIIEQFVLPFKDVLPPDFKLGRYAALGMDLQKAGEDAERAASAGELYRAWYDATPGHQPSQLSWTVAGVTVAIRTALALAKAGIGGSQVHSFLAMRYTEAFWQDKTVSWKHVGEQIGRWLAKSSKVSEVPAIEMDENGMPVGYREMQEARRRADAIVAEKRRNGELR